MLFKKIVMAVFCFIFLVISSASIGRAEQISLETMASYQAWLDSSEIWRHYKIVSANYPECAKFAFGVTLKIGDHNLADIGSDSLFVNQEQLFVALQNAIKKSVVDDIVWEVSRQELKTVFGVEVSARKLILPPNGGKKTRRSLLLKPVGVLITKILVREDNKLVVEYYYPDMISIVRIEGGEIYIEQ